MQPFEAKVKMNKFDRVDDINLIKNLLDYIYPVCDKREDKNLGEVLVYNLPLSGIFEIAFCKHFELPHYIKYDEVCYIGRDAIEVYRAFLKKQTAWILNFEEIHEELMVDIDSKKVTISTSRKFGDTQVIEYTIAKSRPGLLCQRGSSKAQPLTYGVLNMIMQGEDVVISDVS